MKRRWASLLLASAIGICLPAVTPTVSLAHEPHHSINWRQHHQQSRIYQGVRNGQLSAREYRRLEKEEAHIAREEYRFRHNDGHLGSWERAKLQHDLNHASQDIYRDRRD
jgi:hypothetical protein